MAMESCEVRHVVLAGRAPVRCGSGARTSASPGMGGGVVVRRATAGVAPLRLTSRGRWVLMLMITLLLAVVALIGTRATADGPARAVEVESYTVQPGDTLWQLAERVGRSGADVRDVVLELQELNGMSSAGITAGQELVLPARG